MNRDLNLYCILLGCTPKGRNTEQHDVMLAVASSIEELYSEMKLFWYKPMINDITKALKRAIHGLDAKSFSADLMQNWAQRDKVHIDAWMKVEYASEYKVCIRKKSNTATQHHKQLYFVNLGGYKEGEFEEFHKKIFIVATGIPDIMVQLKDNNFMKEHTPAALGTKAKAHLDDKHKVEFEADDIICVSDVLEGYEIVLENADTVGENETMIGYVPLQYKD